MEEEFRYVIHYCFLREMKPVDIISEMKRAYKSNAPGDSTIYKWYNRFRDGRKTIKDDPRSGRPLNLEDNGKILSILEEQPFASARYIGEMLSIPKSTVCHKLVWQLNYRKLNCRWVPHELDSNNKKLRVELSKQILEILENKSNSWLNIVSGDEVWIYWDNENTSQWLPAGSKPPLAAKKTIGSKKSMFAVFLSLRGFIAVKILHAGEKFDSQFMINTVFPEITTKFKSFRPKKGQNGIFIHMDNAPCHNSKVTRDEIDKLGMIRIPHPPYSPDISLCDFWLFGKLKGYLAGCHFSSEKQLFDAIVKFFNSIDKNEIKNVYEEWIKRLHMVIETGGEYIIK